MEVGGNLIAGLGVGVDIEMGVGVDLDGIINTFSSCDLDIFSQPSKFFISATSINSLVVKCGKSDLTYKCRKKVYHQGFDFDL